MEENEAVPSNDAVVESGGKQIWQYRDMSIRGARLSSMSISIAEDDTVVLSANVESINTQTKQDGPHHLVDFIKSNDVASAVTVNMGEFHWSCGHNGPITLTKKLVGAYTYTRSAPKWVVRSFNPRGC